MDRLRLSVVLLLDEPAATEVEGLRRALGPQLLGRERPHITLVPPVNVPDEAIDRALTIIRQASASVAGPINVLLGPAAVFARSGVVYLGISSVAPPQESSQEPSVKGRSADVDAVQRISELRDRVMRPPLWRNVSHEFVPHVTLGSTGDPNFIQAALMAFANFVIPVRLRNVSLLQLGADGVWSVLADCPLGMPLIRGRGSLTREIRLTSHAAPDVESLFLGATSGSEVLEARGDNGVLLGAIGFSIETTVHFSEHREPVRRRRGLIARIAVVAEERGFGVGGMLVDSLLRHLQAERCEAVLGIVDEVGGNTQTACVRALGRRFGFRESQLVEMASFNSRNVSLLCRELS